MGVHMKKYKLKAPWPTSASSEPNRSSDSRYDYLGRALKKVYDKTLEEPIPDRLVELMQQLKKAEDLKKKK